MPSPIFAKYVSVPLRFRCFRGELKVKGKRGIEHRLYFSEPVDTDDDRVVAVEYGRKDPRDLRGSIKQRDHIRKAMEYTKYCFRTQGYGIRPFWRHVGPLGVVAVECNIKTGVSWQTRGCLRFQMNHAEPAS